MEIFEVGNTIRHKKCYWGEPAYYIHEVKPDGASGNPTGSKHGKAWERGGSAHFISSRSKEHYKICPLYMRAWLWLLGQCTEFFKVNN